MTSTSSTSLRNRKMANKTDYTLIPASDEAEGLLSDQATNEDNGEGEGEEGNGTPTVIQDVDPRFNPPAPSAWKRAALLVFVALLFWLAFSMKRSPRVDSGGEKEVHRNER